MTTRSTAFRGLAGLACAGLLVGPAFAQPLGSIAPTQSNGRVLTYPLPAKDGALIDPGNGLIVARVKNAVYAFSIACPHRSVTTLEWLGDTREFHCPRHDAHFQPDGELIDGRPDRAMDRYAIRRIGSNIIVDTSTILQQDNSRDAWSRAVLTV